MTSGRLRPSSEVIGWIPSRAVEDLLPYDAIEFRIVKNITPKDQVGKTPCRACGMSVWSWSATCKTHKDEMERCSYCAAIGVGILKPKYKNGECTVCGPTAVIHNNGLYPRMESYTVEIKGLQLKKITITRKRIVYDLHFPIDPETYNYPLLTNPDILTATQDP